MTVMSMWETGWALGDVLWGNKGIDEVIINTVVNHECSVYMTVFVRK